MNKIYSAIRFKKFYPALRRYLLLSAIFILLPFRQFPQSVNLKLEKYIKAYETNRKVASVSAGIAHKNKIEWLGACGYADIGNHVLAHPLTVYRIASISKVITAVAVMQLVEQGKINLDRDARKYIPYFPRKKWKFSVRQILQHTAGLRAYKPGEFNSTAYYASTKEAVEVIAGDTLMYKPGTKYLYTTLGYNLLAAVIENAAGISFTDYLKKNIFIPAGMFATTAEYHPQIIINEARGYDKNNFRMLQNAPLADLSIKFAGGGLISTSEDLLKFGMALLHGKLIKPGTLDSMLVPTKLAGGKILESGLGFELKTDSNGEKFFGHYGSGTGFVSLLAVYPKDSLVAVDLINTVDRNPGSPALDLAAIYSGKPYRLPLKSLADELMSITLSSGIDSAVYSYFRIKNEQNSEVDISPNELSLFGYDLLKLHRSFDAVKIFLLFLDEHPGNISAYIGLADSYYHDSNHGLALKYYRKALSINANNSYVLRMIKNIESTD